MPRRRPIVLLLLAAAAFALLAAGCGGGGHSPGVASLGATATGTGTGATTTAAPPGGSESSGKPLGPTQQGQFDIEMNVGTVDGAKFSSCMRKHGVPSFPDPNGQGVIEIHSGMGIDPQSPAFQSARTTCQKLLPNGGKPTPAQLAQQQQKLLAFSACMRAHGLKDFPDPSNGGLRLTAHPGSDLDPNSPTFQRAQQACQKDMPFKRAGAIGG